VVNELYVCGRCFGYSKGVEEYVAHVRVCGKGVPGVRVYAHGGGGGDKGGVWEVWEVDGGVETVCIFYSFSFTEKMMDLG
jgi:hypothetical protein